MEACLEITVWNQQQWKYTQTLLTPKHNIQNILNKVPSNCDKSKCNKIQNYTEIHTKCNYE